ncbi:cation diffusion facilitator family transporter [Paenibacillus ginsengarvi]|uniref:Cation transporter n=1 Tax=Paenibacillus ginsengarvi TaxID=400777 RepID=A0A3B0CN41_9BACL|nr:cation diffusion facilitator family transporter [Paenibacillus ginsengarvi]RKN85376.1 cation transporter [Paenibacillus ginsengarvi]
MDLYNQLEQGEKGAWLSIVVYVILSVLKLTVGYLFYSEALRADGLNNTTDIIASVAVLVGLRISRKPPDRNHKYGHFRAETIATLVASFIMAAVGIQVLIQAVLTFFEDSIRTPNMVTAWTALFCGMVMFAVYRYNLALAKRTNSSAVMAAAQDNRSDALVSLGAFLGILGTQFGLNWLDPLAATAVGAVICKTAFDIFRDATHSLSDGFHENELFQYKKTIRKTPGVQELKDIKARAHGNYILLDVTILVDEKLSVAESHLITEDIERRMKEQHLIEHVHIHIEPV